MGKKNKNLMKLRTKSPEKEQVFSYEEKVRMIADSVEFDNARCSVSRKEVMSSRSPLFFMGNSLCNIPSPISISKDVYLSELSSVAIAVPDKLPYIFQYRFFSYLLNELKCSITNMIIAVLTECIQHVISSDIFEAIPMDGIALRNEILTYQNIFKRVDGEFDSAANLNTVISEYGSDDYAIIAYRYFVAPLTASSTKIFADVANEYANNLSFWSFCLNLNSPLIRRIMEMNSIPDTSPLINANKRNIAFAAMSAMFSNYTWSFSGIAECEISRIVLRYQDCRAVYESTTDEVEGYMQ